jgi:hypothetical protein
MVQTFEGLQIQAMAPVDDNMAILDKSDLWGFTLIMGDDATCYCWDKEADEVSP